MHLNSSKDGKKQSDHQKRTVREMMTGKERNNETIEKQKKSFRDRMNNPNYTHPSKGKKFNEDRLNKMSIQTSSRPKKQCPNCFIIMDERNYARYHGIKCKSMKI